MNNLSISKSTWLWCNIFMSDSHFGTGPETEHEFPFDPDVVGGFATCSDKIWNSRRILLFRLSDMRFHFITIAAGFDEIFIRKQIPLIIRVLPSE